MATTSLPDGLLSPRFCPFLIRTSIDVKQLTFAACAFHLKHHKSSNPTRSLHRPRAGGALAQEPSRTSCEVLPSSTGSYLSLFRFPKLPRPAFRIAQDHWRRPNFHVASSVLSRFSPSFATIYRYMASAGFIRFVVCLVDACRLQADSLIHQIKQLHKSADESYLSISSRLNYLLRLLRLSLAHSPTSLISKALRMESHHADLVQLPAAVYSSVKAMMEGTPLSDDDLQLVRIAVYYGLQDNPFQAAFIPRAPDDDTSESDIFQRLMQLEELRLPPPSSVTDDSRLIFRSQTIAYFSSSPFSWLGSSIMAAASTPAFFALVLFVFFCTDNLVCSERRGSSYFSSSSPSRQSKLQNQLLGCLGGVVDAC